MGSETAFRFLSCDEARDIDCAFERIARKMVTRAPQLATIRERTNEASSLVNERRFARRTVRRASVLLLGGAAAGTDARHLRGPQIRGGGVAIDATCLTRAADARGQARLKMCAVAALVLALTLAIAFLGTPDGAYAGRAATGELAFYPCTDCHPVTLGADGKPTKPLPNGKQKHEIELVAHDILGAGDQACLACHQSPSKNPGMLIAPDGSAIEITGDVSRVCQRCHFEKYQQFKTQVHGKGEEKCTAAGCHSPHTPQWIYVAAIPPFQGTGFEVKAVGVTREPFKPFASPPVPPPTYTPTWLVVLTGLGLLFVAAAIGYLVVGRRAR